MRQCLYVTLLLSIFISGPVIAAPCLPSNSPNSQTITGIKVDGKQVKEAHGIILILPQRKEPETSAIVTVGCAFPIGAVIQLPQRTIIEMSSPNGNRITLSPGSRLRIYNVNSKGETYGVEEGEAFFDVKKALDFFHVNYDSFMAQARGASYSVQVTPDKEISFSVKEGKLLVEREVKVRIAEGDKSSTIKVSETMEPDKKREARYRLDTDEYLAKFKNYKDAEEYFLRRLNKDERSGDTDRLTYGLNNMGMILITLSKYQDAITCFEQGLRLARGKRNLKWESAFLNNLGFAYCFLGGTDNLKRAIDNCEKSLMIQLELFPSGVHQDIAKNYLNMGFAYCFLGGADNLKRAIDNCEKSLKIQLELFPSGVHQDIALNYLNLGLAYWTLGGTDNLKRAIDNYEKSMKIQIELFPSGLHQVIAKNYLNMGNAYFDLGGMVNLKRAIENYEKSLKIQLELFPSGVHQDIAKNYLNRGNVYWTLGGTDNLKRAIDNYEKSLKIQLELFPSGAHQDIANNYLNLGLAYFDLGGTDNLKRAIDNYGKSLKIQLELFQSGAHQDIANNYLNLGLAYWTLGGTENLKRAINNYEKSLKIQLELFSSGMHQDIANNYLNLGNAYSDLGGTDNLMCAIENYKKSLKIQLELFPLGVHQDIANNYLNLGNAYSGLDGTDNLTCAIENYEKALKIQLELFPSGVHQDIAKNYLNLEGAYGKLGDYKMAAGAQQKRIDVAEKLVQRGDQSLRRKLPDMYGILAWYELLNQQYDSALLSARRGLELDSTETWIRCNEAHALLYLAREEEARAIYLANRNEKLNESKTFAQKALDDFHLFREKGLGISAMDHIEEELKRDN